MQPVEADARDLLEDLEIPPHVIDVERDAEAARTIRVQFVAKVERLPKRVDAGAFRRGHRVQRFQRQFHTGRRRVFQHLGESVADLGARPGDVPRWR